MNGPSHNSIVLQTGLEHLGLDFSIANHSIVIPALAYVPIGETFRYDSRAFIVLTLLAFATMLSVAQQRLRLGTWQLGSASIAIFGAGHYMEYLWGNQFTLAWSMAFPIIGLSIADQIKATATSARSAARFAAALGFIGAGSLCSAGAAFGFIALAVLLTLKRLGITFKITSIGICVLIFTLAASKLSSGNTEIPAALLLASKSLTALGAVLIGSEVGTTEFGLSPQLIVGCLLFSCLATTGFLQFREDKAAYAFSFSLITFGSLCILSISVSRPYLGNWHLQYALPIILGLIGLTARKSYKHPASLKRRTLNLTIIASVAILALYGTTQAFASYGPSYRQYTASIEDYTLSYLTQPEQQMPFPKPEHTLNKNIVYFLSSKRHVFFEKQNQAWIHSSKHTPSLRPIRVQTGETNTATAPKNIEQSKHPFQIIEAIFAKQDVEATAVVLRTANGYTLPLRRINPDLAIQPLSPDEVAYGGMALSTELDSAQLTFQPSKP